jgi:hypothetical protein
VPFRKQQRRGQSKIGGERESDGNGGACRTGHHFTDGFAEQSEANASSLAEGVPAALAILGRARMSSSAVSTVFDPRNETTAFRVACGAVRDSGMQWVGNRRVWPKFGFPPRAPRTGPTAWQERAVRGEVSASVGAVSVGHRHWRLQIQFLSGEPKRSEGSPSRGASATRFQPCWRLSTERSVASRAAPEHKGAGPAREASGRSAGICSVASEPRPASEDNINQANRNTVTVRRREPRSGEVAEPLPIFPPDTAPKSVGAA